MEDDRYTRITLRIPRDLHARLEAEAAATSKSMNAEIIGRVEDSFRPREDGAELKPVLHATVALLDHKDEVIASHQRLIQLMGFYIGELAGRVQDDSPETAALMRFVENFGRSMAEGKMRDAAEHVSDIVEMGKEMGLIGNDEPADTTEAGREENRRAAFVDAVSEVVGVPLGRAGGSRRQAANPPILVHPIDGAETALTKAMTTIVENVNRPRTPKIPGVNAPKEGLGAPPKAEKPKTGKRVISRRNVVPQETGPRRIKLDHTSEGDDE